MNKRIRKKISKRNGYHKYKDFKNDIELCKEILNEIDDILSRIKDPLEYLYNFMNENKKY